MVERVDYRSVGVGRKRNEGGRCVIAGRRVDCKNAGHVAGDAKLMRLFVCLGL